ncbi:MAG: 30S ribosomal protein S8 [Patescibacteria group bacterium]|nr:30S ribosomal protein S8 [Patescibacteria group bacterium]
MSRDTISELIIGIKNAGKAGKESVKFPYSNFKMSIAEILAKEGYIKSVSKVGKMPKRILEVEIAYKDRNLPKIKDVVRVSKLSKRIYKGSGDIQSIKNGYGMSVLSTSNGVMTDKEARKAKVGGEVLFKIW